MGAPVNSPGRRSDPGGVVAEVEAAGAVEGFLRGASGPVAGQERFLVVVVAGPADGKAPGAGRAGVAQAHQGQDSAVGQPAGDVGELAAVADVDAGQLRPPLSRPGGQALAQRGLGRLRWLGHKAIVPQVPGGTMERVPSSPYVICLGDADRAELESVSRRATASQRAVLRVRIVLLAAGGLSAPAIAFCVMGAIVPVRPGSCYSVNTGD